jgi:hypothetical protein
VNLVPRMCVCGVADDVDKFVDVVRLADDLENAV